MSLSSSSACIPLLASHTIVSARSSVRYTILKHNEKSQRQHSFTWLRDDTGQIPLVEVDRPFKVSRDNNNNYVWASSDSPLLAGLAMRFPHASNASQHPSRRSCPWGR